MIDVDIDTRLGAFHLRAAFAADAPVIGIFGRSGAGKSSVVNAIAGILKPARGSICVDGRCLFDALRGIDLRPEARRCGYVFQDSLLFPHLDVRTNLLYGHRRRSAAERFVEPARVIDLLGLSGLLDRRPATLSGGERQRVAIGRALLAQPRILLFDEPLASLDAPRKGEVLDYIERLRDDVRIPIVYVSHSVSEMARLADTIVMLADGRCTAVGSVEAIFGRRDLEPEDIRETASVIDARVASHDREDALTTLVFDGGQLVVPLIEATMGARMRAIIRARDVSLALRRPEDISIVNILTGRVHSIDARDGVVDVAVAIGSASLMARITRHSLRALAIREGLEVHALVKAVSLDSRGGEYG